MCYHSIYTCYHLIDKMMDTFAIFVHILSVQILSDKVVNVGCRQIRDVRIGAKSLVGRSRPSDLFAT